MTTAADAPARSRGGGVYPYVVLGVLLVVYVLNYLDRQLVSILAEPIKQDLGLNDTQLGLVTGFMFALFYTTFGVPVAWLADRAKRTTIIAVACGLWSLFTGACGLAGNFVQLMLARVGVGVGEAGGVPPSYSILSDYFPPDRRGAAMGLFSLGIPLGTFLGGALGAWAAGHFGWRGAFLAIAGPGVAMALALPFLIREPARAGLDAAGASEPAPPLFTAVGLFLKSASLVLVTLGCALSAVVGYSLQSWTPAFLMRVQGASLAEVGAIYSPVIALSVAAGIFGSGWMVDKLGARSLRAYPLLPAAAFVIAFPLYLLAISVHDWRLSVALLAIPQGLTFTYLAPAVAVVQNLVPPARRATASALLLFVLNLLAVGCGPLYVGAVSDWAKPIHGQESLRIALYALIPFFVLGVGCNYAASVAIKRSAQAAR